MKLRHPLTRSLLPLALAGLLFGCGGDDSTSPGETSDPPLVAGEVGAAGGELIDEQVVLTVPAGALSADTRLEIRADDEGHPFGDDANPVYRIAGLPTELGAPVTLRIRHDLTPAAGDTLTIFLGEEREAYSGGSGLSWFAVAGRDSAGWAICELERGALALAGKSDGEVQAAVTDQVRILGTTENRFEIIYREDQVARAEAETALLTFDHIYDVYAESGFVFGSNDTIWPLDIYIREPVKSIACYVTAPHGAGHFDFDPDLLQPGVQLLPVIVHEMLHCAQTFYDPRPPEQWGVLNQERLWLDEATASYEEALTYSQEDAYPLGLEDDNYKAPLAGLAGHPHLANSAYGYGMSQFVTYLVEVANPVVGEDAILALYTHFREHGDVTDAIDAVIQPPVADWIADFHRHWAENRIFPGFAVVWFWYQWPLGPGLEGATGSEASDTLEIADLGADLVKFVLAGDAPESDSQLLIEAHVGGGQAAETLPLTAYGRRLNGTLERLTTGEDQMLLEDWPTIWTTYEDVLILVSRTRGTVAGYTGSREIEVSATVRPDLSGIDVTSFDNASISVRTNNLFSNSSGVLYNDLISVQSAVSWSNGALRISAPSDTFTLYVDPETLVLGDWYAREQYTSIGGNWFVKRLGGRGVPLESWEETGITYRMVGAQTCDYLTHVFESEASDAQTAPFRYLTEYSCSDGERLYDSSGIYLHLYRTTTKNEED